MFSMFQRLHEDGELLETITAKCMLYHNNKVIVAVPTVTGAGEELPRLAE